MASKLKLIVDIPCQVYCDYELVGTATEGAIFPINLRKGKYIIEIRIDDVVIHSFDYTMESNDEEDLVRLQLLQPMIEKDDYAKFKIPAETYRTLAEKGNPIAQFNLGVCYANGRGVSLDYAQAVEWYRKAAEQGDARAQCNLGVCYETGRGVSQDYAQAVEWYKKAAEQGDAVAQISLGECYANGEGVGQDYAQAVEWYTKAAEQGDAVAIRKVEELEHKITMSDKKTQPKKVSESSSEVKVGPRYLFFDTETTGTPKDYKAPSSDTDNWPRLVQLGWILTDEQGNVLSEGNHIIKPNGFVIPKDAERVHGISTKYACEHGEPIEDVLDLFMADFSKAKYLVGHNISFDKKIVGAEWIRMGKSDLMSTKTSYCTMEAATDFCKIPGYLGYKWPKLQELYKKLFGCDFDDAHDAMADITATCKCFWEMRKRDLI